MTKRTRDGRARTWLAVVLATPVHLVVLALAVLGVWLLWPGSTWAVKVLGVLCLLVAWAVRPGLAPQGQRGGLAEVFVEGATGALRRWEDLLAPYRPDFAISAEHQMILVGSGRQELITHQSRSGLLADVTSLLFWPFRVMARLYRTLLERTMASDRDPR